MKRIRINPENREGQYGSDLPTKKMWYTYLHGELQTLHGYDQFGIIGEPPVYEGIYPAEVVGYENDPATLFLWQGSITQRGLVVLNRDEEGIKYAREQYEKRVNFL